MFARQVNAGCGIATAAALLVSLVGAAYGATTTTSDMPEVTLKPATDTHQPIRLKPSKPHLIKLEYDIGDVTVDDQPQDLAAFAYDARTLALFPKQKSGGAHVVVLGKGGEKLMSRYVFISEPGQKYIRVREPAASDAQANLDRVYFCPNLCYETHLVAPPPAE